MSLITMGFYIAFYQVFFSVPLTTGLFYPWEEPSNQIRLYMPDQQFGKAWRVEDLTNGVSLFHDPAYDPYKPTMLITHGWFQSADDPVLVMLTDSLFEVKFYQKMNIMVLDAPYFLDSILSNISYFSPASKIEMLGNVIADIFNKAIDRSLLKPENINLVGLSLGAQLNGYIGRATKGQIHSIVGLDPAGPGFDSSSLQAWTKFRHVSKTDARFVHLYHTNSVTFGTFQRLGTADFEFNIGISQPGCVTSIDPKCSHKRAFYIFNDIILGNNNLVALRCDTHQLFTDCKCRENPSVLLQYPIDTRAEGVYFLKTAHKSPFGLGKEGITCWKDQWQALQQEKEVEKLKTANALKEITDKFMSKMALLQHKETLLAIIKPKASSDEDQ